MNKLELQKTANEVRKGIVTAVHGAKAGHPGGSLSAADIFTYIHIQRVTPCTLGSGLFLSDAGQNRPGLLHGQVGQIPEGTYCSVVIMIQIHDMLPPILPGITCPGQ